MGNASTASERVQVGTIHEDLGSAVLFELDPNVVVPANRRGRRGIAPREAASAQLALAAADCIAAEIEELLRRGPRLALAEQHQLMGASEEGVRPDRRGPR